MIVSVRITLPRRSGLDLIQAERVEKGSKRDARANREISSRAGARKTDRESGRRWGMCMKSSLWITHITSRLVFLMSPFYLACIPSHCIRILPGYESSQDQGSSHRNCDPREIHKRLMVTSHVCDVRRGHNYSLLLKISFFDVDLSHPRMTQHLGQK